MGCSSRRCPAALALLLLFLSATMALAAPLDAIYPASGSGDVPRGRLTLIWEEYPDMTYRLRFGESAGQMNPVTLSDSSLPMADVVVETSRTYYWQACAVSGDEEIACKVHSFSTAAIEAAQLERVYPTGADAEEVPFGRVTLHWRADREGLLFDVYLGENAVTMERQAQNLSLSLFDVSLESSKKYFWQIRARDGEGNVTISPIWTFRTAYDDSIGGGCSLAGAGGALFLLPLACLLMRR